MQLNRSITELTLKLKTVEAGLVQVNNQKEQKEQLINQSYMPRQIQLKSLALDGAETTAESGPGGYKDASFLHELKEDKTAANQEIEQLEESLAAKK